VIVHQLGKAAFGALAELVVMRGFLADYEASASITRVKPDGCGRRCSAAAIEAYPRAHLDERRISYRPEDHGFADSLYVPDPDGNVIELTCYRR